MESNTQAPLKQGSSYLKLSATIKFDDRYYLKRLLRRYPRFDMYEGIDAIAYRFVTIYVNKANSGLNISKKIKGQFRTKVSPHALWEGCYKNSSSTFNVEIHQKFGPSIKQVFAYLKQKINQKDFLHLMYQIIKLIQKINSSGYVYRDLDPEEIIFDIKPEKPQLHLLNSFPLRKKGQQTPALTGKFSAKAAHLGLRASYKDDLQSICYILLEIYTNGNFLKGILPSNYLNEKSNLDFESMGRRIPEVFKDFYHYVISLNYNDEVNLYSWKCKLYNLLGPYGWLRGKAGQNSSHSDSPSVKANISIQIIQNQLQNELDEELDARDKQTLESIQNKFISAFIKIN